MTKLSNPITVLEVYTIIRREYDAELSMRYYPLHYMLLAPITRWFWEQHKLW